ncbi:MAG: alkaline phosphatase family protein, partial [Pirellulaceae bacterium]
YSGPRDDLYTRVALYLLEQRQANLVLLHLITPDGVEHTYGPHTPEAYIAVAEADAHIRRIWDALQRPPLAGKSALFVTSDHGFAPIRRVIRPNVVLKELGLIQTDEANKVTQRQAWSVAQGGSAFLYLLGDSRTDARRAELTAAMGRLEGVERVLSPAEFAALGLPAPDANPQAPDLILTTGPGYTFANEVTGESVGPGSESLKGTHGHLPEPAYMHATFVAAGAGIRRGAQLPLVRNTDVAPTVAQLLGLPFPTTDGRVLSEFLAP